MITVTNEVCFNKFLTEFKLFSQFNHDSILKCEEIFWVSEGEQKRTIYAFLDYMDGGDISKIIPKSGYTEDFCKYVLYKVALGLKEMHSQGILHRDIKD